MMDGTEDRSNGETDENRSSCKTIGCGSRNNSVLRTARCAAQTEAKSVRLSRVRFRHGPSDSFHQECTGSWIFSDGSWRPGRRERNSSRRSANRKTDPRAAKSSTRTWEDAPREEKVARLTT